MRVLDCQQKEGQEREMGDPSTLHYSPFTTEGILFQQQDTRIDDTFPCPLTYTWATFVKLARRKRQKHTCCRTTTVTCYHCTTRTPRQLTSAVVPKYFIVTLLGFLLFGTSVSTDVRGDMVNETSPTAVSGDITVNQEMVFSTSTLSSKDFTESNSNPELELTLAMKESRNATKRDDFHSRPAVSATSTASTRSDYVTSEDDREHHQTDRSVIHQEGNSSAGVIDDDVDENEEGEEGSRSSRKGRLHSLSNDTRSSTPAFSKSSQSNSYRPRKF